MSSIDEKIKDIKSYIISMRYNKGMAIVDTKLNTGWVIPKSKVVGAVAYDKSPNTYMFYSEDEGVVIDDIIEYVKHVVNVNLEREAKSHLLTFKLAELKECFDKHNLSELKTLEFKIINDSPQTYSDEIKEYPGEDNTQVLDGEDEVKTNES